MVSIPKPEGRQNRRQVERKMQSGIGGRSWLSYFAAPFTFGFRLGVIVLLGFSSWNAASARANSTIFQLSAWESYQLFDSSYSIYGFRFNLLHGKNEFLYGIDLGLANEIQRGAHGLQIGLINLNRGYSFTLSTALYESTGGRQYGVSLPLIAITDGNVDGFQVGWFYNRGKEFKLPQIGGWNEATASPLQIGWMANYSLGPVQLGQLSILGNETGEKSSFQISGGWNQAKIGYVQIGGIYNGANVSIFQLSGVINGARDEVAIQLSGIANVFKEPEGAATVNDGPDLAPVAQISLFYNEAQKAHSQFGMLNLNKDWVWLQTGLSNQSSKALLQIGAINITRSRGFFKFGLINGDLTGGGLRLGMANVAFQSGGLQAGFINISGGFSGISVGIVNATLKLRGLQLGVLNINASGPIPFFPGINVGF